MRSDFDRAAIACTMPTIHPQRCIMLDVGANVDCTANQLFQFGLMGSILAKGLHNIENPKVGVLNIGTENTKGNELVKEVYKMIKKSNHLNRLVTLSPLTEMARKFHLRNGAVELQVNETTQNFEYKVIK